MPHVERVQAADRSGGAVVPSTRTHISGRLRLREAAGRVLVLVLVLVNASRVSLHASLHELAILTKNTHK